MQVKQSSLFGLLLLPWLVGCGFHIGKVAVSPASSGVTWDGQIQAVFANNCVSCHGEIPDSDAPPQLHLDDYSSAYSEKDAIKAALEKGEMPLGATLADADKELILAWIDLGALEN